MSLLRTGTIGAETKILNVCSGFGAFTKFGWSAWVCRTHRVLVVLSDAVMMFDSRMWAMPLCPTSRPHEPSLPTGVQQMTLTKRHTRSFVSLCDALTLNMHLKPEVPEQSKEMLLGQVMYVHSFITGMISPWASQHVAGIGYCSCLPGIPLFECNY